MLPLVVISVICLSLPSHGREYVQQKVDVFLRKVTTKRRKLMRIKAEKDQRMENDRASLGSTHLSESSPARNWKEGTVVTQPQLF